MTIRLTKAQKARILEWCDVLEHGNLEQGLGNLCRKFYGDPASDDVTTKYCCLGVACEIYAAKVGGFFDDLTIPGTNGAKKFVCDYIDDRADSTSAMLPIPVGEWFNLPEGVQSYLAGLNDSGAWTFTDIAWLLRQYVKRPSIIQKLQTEAIYPEQDPDIVRAYIHKLDRTFNKKASKKAGKTA